MRDGHGNPLTPEQVDEIRRPSGAPAAADQDPTPALIAKIAQDHGVDAEAVMAALVALRRGQGTMAQFSHPTFGGMAQWSAGGMSMVGDMFNAATKAKLDGVLKDLSAALGRGEIPMAESQRAVGVGEEPSLSDAWPEGLGSLAATGSQNNLRYGFFPEARKLVIVEGLNRTIYETGDHIISGVSQQQGDGQTLSFQSQFGSFSLTNLALSDDR
ncbi:hypothetical protein [Bosea sp. BK604]|uniref:hypothetical protein n=1 Tax=Bosea sp. BK604 TaxID=2512180 RepID=UPI0010F027BC|nr:hypothetical protein [Bosea sp. BK604]TCR68248.1 hypothetical protein EV560_10275 [Bosea sp. BK604]